MSRRDTMNLPAWRVQVLAGDRVVREKLFVPSGDEALADAAYAARKHFEELELNEGERALYQIRYARHQQRGSRFYSWGRRSA